MVYKSEIGKVRGERRKEKNFKKRKRGRNEKIKWKNWQCKNRQNFQSAVLLLYLLMCPLRTLDCPGGNLGEEEGIG
jgi:hypothetical protein